MEDLFVTREAYYDLTSRATRNATLAGGALGLVFGMALMFTLMSFYFQPKTTLLQAQTVAAQKSALLEIKYAEEVQAKYAKKLLALNKTHKKGG